MLKQVGGVPGIWCVGAWFLNVLTWETPSTEETLVWSSKLAHKSPILTNGYILETPFLLSESFY